MKRLWGVVFPLAVLGAATASADPLPLSCPPPGTSVTALSTPTAVVMVNTSCFSFNARPLTGNPQFQWEIPFTSMDLTGGDSFFLSALFDVDPMVSFIFGDINASGTTLIFDVFFTTFVVGGPYDQQANSGSATQTATGADTTGTVTYNAGGLATAWTAAHNAVPFVRS